MEIQIGGRRNKLVSLSTRISFPPVFKNGSTGLAVRAAGRGRTHIRSLIQCTYLCVPMCRWRMICEARSLSVVLTCSAESLPSRPAGREILDVSRLRLAEPPLALRLCCCTRSHLKRLSAYGHTAADAAERRQQGPLPGHSTPSLALGRGQRGGAPNFESCARECVSMRCVITRCASSVCTVFDTLPT